MAGTPPLQHGRRSEVVGSAGGPLDRLPDVVLAPPATAFPPLEVERLRRILVVRLDNIGDMVMLGPALRALRSAAPAATVTLLASPAGRQAAALLPWLDETIELRALWQDASGRLPFDPEFGQPRS